LFRILKFGCPQALISEIELDRIYSEVFNQLDVFTALRFKGTGALLAVERMGILPMTQHADNIWNEGKFLPLFTDHRRC
jgi:hypothetical protein